MATAVIASKIPVKEKSPARGPLWNVFNVEFRFLGRLCASVPASHDLMRKWLESRKPSALPPGGKTINEIQEEVFATIAEAEEETREEMLLVFQRVDGGLVLRAATFRAHIKDCARTLSNQYIGKMAGERSFSTRVINGLYHDENQYWVPILGNNGTQLTEADGHHQKTVHARGARGQQINALKEFEFLQEPIVRFRLKALGKSVRLDDLETIFSYGSCHGYGGERGDGEGRYTFTVTPEAE